MRQLGPYTLSERLGAGGMAEVWKGQRVVETGATKDVAVKLLHPSHAGNEQYLQMFLDEARLSMLLTSANIVQVFDVGSELDEYYMVMEWIDGLDLEGLSARLRDAGRKLAAPLVAFIIGELLKALAHAHDFRHDGRQWTIVHRDVSPHNVMISGLGDVKLMDFGIARLASEDTSGVHVKGKLRYMPPEQFAGETRRPTIDLFAIGAILHELLDGRKFRGDAADNSHLFGMVMRGDVPPLAAPAEVPRELDELRRALLAADPGRRLASAREAFRLLRSWPGYVDAKFELQDLVSSLMASAVVPPGLDAAGVTVALGTDVSARSGAENLQTDRSGRVAPGIRGELEQTLRQVIARAEPRLRRAIVAILLGGATIVAGLVGAVIAWSTDDADPDLTSEATPKVADDIADDVAGDADPLPEPPSRAPSSPAPAPAPAPTPDEAAPPIAQPEEPTEPEPPEPSDDDDATTDAPDPVTVTIAAPGHNYVELRFAGRRTILDRFGQPTRTRAVRPGLHRVTYRDSIKGEWKSAGDVVIPDRRCRLELVDGQARVR